MRPESMQENSRKNKDVGDEGEELACRHLASEGFAIVARNVRYRTGEIDIVARRGQELHFVEVRTRSDPTFVSPLESITVEKQRRIRRTAEWYLSDPRNGFNENNLPPCYFSVIGIDYAGDIPRIECVLDAFV